MKKIRNTIAALLLGLVAGGCSDDTFFTGGEPGDGSLNVNYLVDGEVLETRSVQAVDDEIKLESALIFFYDIDTGKALCSAYVKPSAGKRTLSFDPPSGLLPDVEYNTLVLGNPDNYTGGKSVESFAESIMDLDYLTARLEIKYNRRNAIVRDSPGVLPMFGQFVDVARKTPKTFRYRESDGLVSTEGMFYFSRAVSRIDLENFVPSTLLVESVKVINYQAEGYPLTEGLKGSDIIDYTHSGPAGWMNVQPLQAGETDQRLSSSLYCFPNIVVASQPDDKITTALLIKGKYCEKKDGSEYDSESTYYRFNLCNTGKGQVLMRNYAYKATIKGVKRRGSKTPEEAINDHLPIFDYDVTDDWQATDDNAVSDDRGNYLIISKSFITFDGDDSRSNMLNLRVQTNNDLVWSVAPDDSEESIDNSHFICEKGDENTLRVAPVETNDTPHVRFGRFIVTARSSSDPSVELKLTVNIQQLTTEFNYSMLTVDGCTGTIVRKLNPNGGVLRLKVLTGAASNAWFTEDADNAVKNWGPNSHFSELGNNGADLEIVYDANVSGSARSTTLRVYLDPDINKDNVVKPVFVTLTQDITTDLFTLSPAPVDGAYTIDCCSYENIPTLTPHTLNISAKKIVLAMNPAAGVKVTVKHNFHARDITLDKKNWYGPATTVNMQNIFTEESKFNTISNNVGNSEVYYIAVEAMAPGDPAITGYKMIFTATDPVSGNVQKRMITFKLKAIEGDVNDCIVKQGADYYLITDRNYGTPGKISITGERENAKYYANSSHLIPEFQESKPVNLYSQYLGTGLHPNYSDNTPLQQWIRDVNNDDEALYSPFFKTMDYEKWGWPTADIIQTISKKFIFSKCRAYILSEFPRLSPEGKKIPVFRWFNLNSGINLTTRYSGKQGGIKINLINNLFESNVSEGQTFPMRKLSKEGVKNYLLDYLGYTESTLPAELRN